MRAFVTGEASTWETDLVKARAGLCCVPASGWLGLIADEAYTSGPPKDLGVNKGYLRTQRIKGVGQGSTCVQH